MFDLCLLPKVDLERLDGGDGRRYVLPDGTIVPSVTTVLSRYPNPVLEAWKERVGPEKAAEAAAKGATRGTHLHNACESYVLTGQTDPKMPVATKYAFKPIKRLLDNNVTKVYGVEHQVYSKRLKMAGTTDLVCDWNGMCSVVDFKTSNWTKSPEDVMTYWFQETLYSIMLQELYGIVPKQLVMIMSVELNKSLVPLVWVKQRSEFLSPLKEFLKIANKSTGEV